MLKVWYDHPNGRLQLLENTTLSKDRRSLRVENPNSEKGPSQEYLSTLDTTQVLLIKQSHHWHVGECRIKTKCLSKHLVNGDWLGSQFTWT